MKILVVIPMQEQHKAVFEACAPGAEFVYCPQKEVTKELVQEANIIVGNVPASMIAGSPNLQWLQLNSAGTDGYTAPGVLPEGAKLTNATGAYGLALAEHMLAQLMCLIKKLHLYMEDQKDHVWGDRGNVVSIWNSTTLVVGMGDIGSEFAKRMHALGSRVIGIRRNKAEKPDYLDGLYQMDALEEWLPKADFVATMLPGTPETYHVFDAKRLAMMKEGAFLLNIGRGNAVDSYALTEALNSGHLAGAGLDVTEPEPLPKDHPLWEAKNVMITPHISGFYHLPETLERIVRIATENLQKFLAGEELRNEVDFATGYRKFKG
ncbi:MAG: D-2-hydroxyacid dehydrogenase [Lachnospiraceae bacterium]|nr:D-2-hydroxyacid dehydrogenase [Lachnospiraceae bacterium]